MTNTKLAEIIEWQEREHPVCPDCTGHVGIDCSGHCVDCGDVPIKGEDYCRACFDRINGSDAAPGVEARAARDALLRGESAAVRP